MNNLFSSKTLKQTARGQLLGKYKTTCLSYLMVQMILWVVLQFAASYTTYSLAGTVLYYAIYFIVVLIGGIFTFGQCHLYLRIVREDTCSFGDTWYGFQHEPDKAIGIQFLVSVAQLLCGIPFYICYALWSPDKSPVLTIALLATLLLFLVFATVVSLMFSQSFYLLTDHPDWKIPDIVKESIRLMEGHKKRLFYIQISFFGLVFLGILTLGIGMLWVTPYMYMVRANFYENLCLSRTGNGLEEKE